MSVVTVVSVAFRFINFGVLIGIGYILSRRYLMPFVQDQLRARVTEIDQLHALKKLLIKDMADVERVLITDHHEIGRLKEKMVQWKTRVDHDKAIMAMHKEERMKIEQTRVRQQMEKIKQVHLFTLALPLAIEHAADRLTKKFSAAHAQETYMRDLTLRIKGF